MGSILSMNIYSYEQTCALASDQLWMLTHQGQNQLFMRIPLLNRLCGISYPLEFSRIQRVWFWCGLWGAYCMLSSWVYLDLYSTSWFYIFLAKSVFGTLINLSLNFSILKRLCKNKPPNSMTIYEAKKRWVKNPYGGSFDFCKINAYGL